MTLYMSVNARSAASTLSSTFAAVVCGSGSPLFWSSCAAISKQLAACRWPASPNKMDYVALLQEMFSRARTCSTTFDTLRWYLKNESSLNDK